MIRRLALTLLMGNAIATCGLTEDWPQWRGPRGDSISTEKGIATKWSPTENILWRCELPGPGGATPIAWKDRLYVTSSKGDDLVLMCIDAKTGKPVWEQQVGTGNQNARAGEGNSASPSPSTDGQHVYAFFSTGVMACYTMDGKKVWSFDANERFGKIDIQFGMSSTPYLHGDSLYMQLIHGAMKRGDQTRTGKVIRLNKLTGETLWEVDRPTEAQFECKHSYASPFVYDDGKAQFLVVHGADCTTGHDLRDGKEIWRLGELNGPSLYNKGQAELTFRFVASPSVVPGAIIIPTCKAGPTVALRVNENLKGQIAGNDKVVRWSFPKTPDVAIPLVKDGLVYNLHNDGKFQCLDLESGQEYYIQRTHSAQHRSSPFFADGHIYLCNRDGICTVMKEGKEFSVVATNDLGESITASPIASNGVLYLRTYQALYAIKQN